MNKTEKLAEKYLKEKLGFENPIFSHHRSPDFLLFKEHIGYEVKKLIGNSIIFSCSQFEYMKKLAIPITVIVFDNHHEEPILSIPLTEIQNNKKFQNLTVKILPDVPSTKIDNAVKTELEKVAGEVQAVKGGNVTLSDAVDFLITFYHEHKETKA